MTTRRGFLGSILAAAVAPAIVRADSLMRIIPRETTFIATMGPGSDGLFVVGVLPARGDYTLIQWIEDDVRGGAGVGAGGLLNGMELPAGAEWTPPAGVAAVWTSLLQETERGVIRNRGTLEQSFCPMRVTPGQTIVIP